MNKTIGIDCRLAGKRHAGLGRYIENLVTRVIKNKQLNWVLFFYSQAQAKEILGEKIPSNIKIIITPIKHYSLKEQIILPSIFNKERLDLLHIPHFNVPIIYRGKLIVTIHDLLWHEQRGKQVTTLPIWKYFFKYLSYKIVVSFATQKAKIIIVPSNTIKKTLLKFYPDCQNKIKIIKEGIVSEFWQNKFPQKINKTLLYLGSLYPHKNLKIVFQALKRLPRYKLKIIGSRDAFLKKTQKQVEEMGVKNQVEFLGYQSDKKLINLMQTATALVQPSLSEGFGLTGLEAMAAGCPVLASNIPIFQEIYAKAAFYFDPHESDSFLKALKNLENTSQKLLINRGQKQAKQYSWDKMAQEILGLYQKS